MRFSDLRELQTAADMAGLEMEFLELRQAAIRGDAAVAVLRDLDARLRECMALGLSAIEAYDSAYQYATADVFDAGAR